MGVLVCGISLDSFAFGTTAGEATFLVRLRQNLSVVLRRLTQWFYLSNEAAVIGKRGNRI